MAMPLMAHAQSTSTAHIGAARLPSLFAPECNAVNYATVTVYDSPDGIRIGKLVLDHPEYVKTTQVPCVFKPEVYLTPEGTHQKLGVHVFELPQQETVLSVFEVSRYNGKLWAKGRTQYSTFWVPVTGARKYMSLEGDLKQGLRLFTEKCDELGRCQPTSAKLQKDVRAAASERPDGCGVSAYDIVDTLTLPTGRKAYRIRMAPSLTLKYGQSLPLEALVPTYDYRGVWTGAFQSDCDLEPAGAQQGAELPE